MPHSKGLLSQHHATVYLICGTAPHPWPQVCSIARPEWGAPAAFGSAAKAEALVRQMARKRRMEQQAQAAEENGARRQPLGK